MAKKQHNNPTDTANKESLPIGSARFIAFIAVAMSVGFVVVIYAFFLKDLFVGNMLLGVLTVMLVLSLVSSVVALRNIMPKLLCPHCQQPFFRHVSSLFAKAGNCQHCQQSIS